jgi:hypothetical protein
LRGSLLDAQGAVRKDIFKPRGDIHLNVAGTQIVSLRIQQMLTIMLPNLMPDKAPVPAPVQTPPAPVQTTSKVQRARVQAPVSDPGPVVVNGPPAVDATLVAAVVNAPAVEQVQNVAPETPMEVEDEDALLQRLFFKRFGRALPEKEKEKDDVDQINFVIDLTDDTEEMEDDTTPLLIPNLIVKTEPIEIANVNNVTNESGVASVANVDIDNRRRSFRLERLEIAKARKAITEFGKSLRRTDVIPEKEAPDDTDMAEDVSVNAVESVNTVETVEQTIAALEAAIAATEAAIAASDANQREFADEFGDTPIDEFDD